MKCRFCGSGLSKVFADLGAQPPSNAYLRQQDLVSAEIYYPLKAYVCEDCLLVQLPEFKSSREIFNENYAYYSSFSSSWLEHSERYASRMISELELDADSTVVELASNDGYLLQYFAQRSIPCYGVEPSQSVAEAAIRNGIDTVVAFFGADLAGKLLRERGGADLIAANNVLAHLPDINDFVAGIAILLADDGLFTAEFPHIAELIDRNAFDTIYHEHYSYLSFGTIRKIFARAGMRVFDVERLGTHGGSLRIFASKSVAVDSPDALEMLDYEKGKGLDGTAGYMDFQERCTRVKNDFLEFLLTARSESKRVWAYGAAAKGNTLLNFCGIKGDLVRHVADLSPHKQGLYLPGSRIEICPPERLYAEDPDYIVLFPWNLKDEIIRQLRDHDMTGRFVMAVPELEVSD
jgi:SAM-dependent methyltransferase